MKYFIKYSDGETEEITRKEMEKRLRWSYKEPEVPIKLLENGELPEVTTSYGTFFVRR